MRQLTGGGGGGGGTQPKQKRRGRDTGWRRGRTNEWECVCVSENERRSTAVSSLPVSPSFCFDVKTILNSYCALEETRTRGKERKQLRLKCVCEGAHWIRFLSFPGCLLLSFTLPLCARTHVRVRSARISSLLTTTHTHTTHIQTPECQPVEASLCCSLSLSPSLSLVLYSSAYERKTRW